MKNKPNMIIRIGAAHWDARVFSNGTVTHFDIAAMDKHQRKAFIFATVKTFREHQLQTVA